VKLIFSIKNELNINEMVAYARLMVSGKEYECSAVSVQFKVN